MYKYETEKINVFTDEGQKMFLAIRDNIEKCLAISGAVRMGNAIDANVGGNSWTMIACVDRMVELGEIKEVKMSIRIAGQDRIFVKAKGC